MEYTNELFTDFSINGINALPRFGEKQSIDLSQIVRPLTPSIAAYIHIPYCKHICQFCMLRRGAKAVSEVPEIFVETLIKEFSLYRGLLAENKLDAVYFGGGTASMLSATQFEKILNAIRRNFEVLTDAEITFEGEAASLTKYELVSALSSNGVSRISFGVQTFVSEIRDLLGRTDSVKELREVSKLLYAFNFKEINVDYMYNLPNISMVELASDIQQLLELNPTSVDCHPLKYASCSSFMLQQIVDRQMSVPNAELRAASFEFIKHWMSSNGYGEQFADQYSKRKLAKTNIYMQHLYGLRGGEYIGFGPGARSHFGDYGYSNVQSADSYIKLIANNGRPLEKMVKASLADNFITCFPKRNDILTQREIEDSDNAAFYFKKLNILTAKGFVNFDSDGYQLTEFGLKWYQNLQEFLLSPDQSDKHQETADKRSLKLHKFGSYFQNLNHRLKHGCV